MADAPRAAGDQLQIGALTVVVDRPLGTVCDFRLPDGTTTQRTWPTDYGYIPSTTSGDGQGLDVFLGPDLTRTTAFWVEHTDASGAANPKVMLGFGSLDAARAVYETAYPPAVQSKRWHTGTVGDIAALVGTKTEDMMSKLQTASDDGAPLQLDLGVGDVSTPSGDWSAPSGAAKVDLISQDTRDSLDDSQFALPAKRKYPIDTAKRTRNAAARLEQAKKSGKVSDDDYAAAKGRIARAAKKFGIDSQYNASDDAAPPRKRRRKIVVKADIASGGRLSVRHMADRVFYDCEGVSLAEAALGADATTPVWIQLAKSGAFAGHPAGPFELGNKTFSEIVANFKSTQNRRLPIDYEHASEADPTSGSIPLHGAPAQGWIVDMKIDGDALWGLVEWLEPARTQIRSGQYKYISPAIRFGSKDRVTGRPIGARITSAGLTNTPFLDGMQPLAAKDTVGEGGGECSAAPAAAAVDARPVLARTIGRPDEYMPRLKDALGLDPLCGAEEVSDQVLRLREACATSTDGTFDGVRLDDYLQPLGAIVGAAPNCTVDALLDTVDTMIDAAMARHMASAHGGDQDTADALSKAAARSRSGLTQPAQPPAAMSAATHEEDTIMANQDPAVALKDAQEKAGKLALELKDVSDKATAAEAKATSLEAANAKLELQLKDVGGRADTAEATVKAISKVVTCKDGETVEVAAVRIVEEHKSLLADKAAREAADLERDVEEAFQTWKDAKSLKDEDKPRLLKFARADKATFNEMFPPVPLDERMKLRKIAPPAPRPAGEAAVALSFHAMTSLVLEEAKKEGRQITLTDAQHEAIRRMDAAADAAKAAAKG